MPLELLTLALFTLADVLAGRTRRKLAELELARIPPARVIAGAGKRRRLLALLA
jgi:hypothetical protein